LKSAQDHHAIPRFYWPHRKLSLQGADLFNLHAAAFSLKQGDIRMVSRFDQTTGTTHAARAMLRIRTVDGLG
jgi:hypothetical protein